MRRLCREARLPLPVANVKVCGWEVDLLWPQHQLIIEVDGFAAHGHRAAFERDRRKQTELVAGGYRVIRITWRQLRIEPLAVIAAVALALANRS
jgi:very-short-patch-repair endonuclease